MGAGTGAPGGLLHLLAGLLQQRAVVLPVAPVHPHGDVASALQVTGLGHTGGHLVQGVVQICVPERESVQNGLAGLARTAGGEHPAEAVHRQLHVGLGSEGDDGGGIEVEERTHPQYQRQHRAQGQRQPPEAPAWPGRGGGHDVVRIQEGGHRGLRHPVIDVGDAAANRPAKQFLHLGFRPMLSHGHTSSSARAARSLPRAR